MKTAVPKTWLEKQSDEVQLFVLSMEQEGVSYEEKARRVHKRFAIRITAATLCNSLAHVRARLEKEFLESRVISRELVGLLQRHPRIDPGVLIRGYFLTKLGSEEFRAAEIKPKDLLSAVHREQKLRLDDRRVRALEQHNRLKRESLVLSERRVKVIEQRQAQFQEGIKGALADEKASTEETLRRIREVYGLFDEPSSAGTSDVRPPECDSSSALPGEVGAG